MKLLIVKLGAIGDIIHTLPALSAIRKGRPDVEIGWVAESRSAEILRGHRAINELIEIDTRRWRSGISAARILTEIGSEVSGLRRSAYDVALDFQGLIKSAAIAKASGAGERWGFSRKDLREPASRILLNHAVRIPRGAHVIEKNLTLARTALSLDAGGALEFDIHTSASDRDEARKIADAAGGEFAILNPAGGWVTKLWHPEKFGQLADRIYHEHGLASVVATGPAEAELAARVMAASATAKIISVQPSLKGFFELAKLARIYVGGDTGPTHLAIAASTPVVGIFGPTEWWRNGSLNPQDICVERVDIGCRIDCHRRECSNWICMDIEADTMADAVTRRLADRR